MTTNFPTYINPEDFLRAESEKDAKDYIPEAQNKYLVVLDEWAMTDRTQVVVSADGYRLQEDCVVFYLGKITDGIKVFCMNNCDFKYIKLLAINGVKVSDNYVTFDDAES